MTQFSRLSLVHHVILVLVRLLLTAVVVVVGGKVPAIIVFGDSTVDAGNNNVIPTVLKSNFRPYGRDFYDGTPTGRFSNGRVATDFISEAIGLKPIVPAYLDPGYTITDFADGVSFASAGTGFDNATSDVLEVIPLWREVELFEEYRGRLEAAMGKQKARRRLMEALYIVSIGTNDFMENYYTLPCRSAHFSIDQYEDFLIKLAGEFFTKIYQLGGRKISMTGLTPIGCLPMERAAVRGHDCVEKYNHVARSFNAKLQTLVVKLNANLPGLRMVLTHVYDFLQNIIQNPDLYGYENVEKGCCATGTFEMGYLCSEGNPFTCDDADKFVFWDAFHPSEKTNRIIAYHNINTSLVQFL